MYEDEVWTICSNKQFTHLRKVTIFFSTFVAVVCIGITVFLVFLDIYFAKLTFSNGRFDHAWAILGGIFLIGLLFGFFGWRGATGVYKILRNKLPRNIDLEIEPWLGNIAWRDRCILYKGLKFISPIVWVGGGILFSISIFAVAVSIVKSAQDNNWMWLILGGVEIIAFPIIMTYFFMRKKKYGVSICHLKTLPTWIGSDFEANIEIKFPNKNMMPTLPSNGVQLELINGKFTGYKNNKMEIYWETKGNISIDKLSRPGDGTIIVPIRIGIPKNVIDCYGGRDSFWRLNLRADYPGIDYFSEFHVPIYDSNK